MTKTRFVQPYGNGFETLALGNRAQSYRTWFDRKSLVNCVGEAAARR